MAGGMAASDEMEAYIATVQSHEHEKDGLVCRAVYPSAYQRTGRDEAEAVEHENAADVGLFHMLCVQEQGQHVVQKAGKADGRRNARQQQNEVHARVFQQARAAGKG